MSAEWLIPIGKKLAWFLIAIYPLTLIPSVMSLAAGSSVISTCTSSSIGFAMCVSVFYPIAFAVGIIGSNAAARGGRTELAAMLAWSPTILVVLAVLLAVL